MIIVEKTFDATLIQNWVHIVMLYRTV